MDTTVDWKKGPGFKEIDTITLPHYDTKILPNGIQFIEIQQGTQEIVKLDIVFRGGRLTERKKLEARFTASLMREGTVSYNSAQLANHLDFYGAIVRVANNLDHIYLSLTCLTKYFDKVLPAIREIIYEPALDEKELLKLKKNTSERLVLDLAKNDVVSYRVFTEALYGSNHVYGYNTEAENIAKLERNDLIEYHKNALGSDNCYIVLAGRYSSVISDMVTQAFGHINHKSNSYLYQPPAKESHKDTITVSSKNEHQSSVKIGRRMFSRHHEDYGSFFVLSTILGGYFGSRLMTSVREDLGYTYNIYSALDFMIYDGYFYIATEVGNEFLADTLSEIKNNIEKLQDKKVSKSELVMVKSYLRGNMLHLIDGPLNSSNTIRSLELDFCLNEHFTRFLKDIDVVTPARLQKLAQQYLQWEDMTTVIVGDLG